MNAPIVVNDGTATHSIAPDRVYFTFSSGRLSYDCAACRAECCRGHSYHITRPTDIRRHVERHPTAALFFESEVDRGRSTLRVRNCPPACFFLSDSGLCRIHQELGFDEKPETCRLFPFNDLILLGDYLVVRPHAGICPLRLTNEGDHAVESRHEDLLATLGRHGVAVSVRRFGLADAAKVVARETQILEDSCRYSSAEGLYDFTAAQLARARGPLQDGGALRAAVDDYTRRVCALLAARRPDSDTLGRLFIAMTPYLRSRLLFDGAVLENNDRPLMDHDHAPLALLALFIIAECARAVGMTEVTFQTVTRLLQDFAPLICLLSMLDDVVAWRPAAPLPLPVGRDRHSVAITARLAKLLHPASQSKVPLTVEQVIAKCIDVCPDERLRLVKEVARSVYGRVCRCAAPVRWRRRDAFARRLGDILHRFGVAHLSEETLRGVYARAVAGKGRK